MGHFRFIPALIAAVACLGLQAQGIFSNATSPTSPICPRMLRDKTSMEWRGFGQGADSGTKLYHQEGSALFPPEERKSVSAFAAYDERSQGTSIAKFKGKVVLVGLWSTRCDPSAKMLMEFASIYPKREQFGFEILAVNFDENQQDGGGIEGGWRAIHKFMNRNRQFFEASKMPVFTPGLGKEGAANFLEMVWSLPVLYLVDREGRLAEIHIGYKEGFVGEALKRGLRERLAPVAPPPAATSAPAAADPAPATPGQSK